MSAESIETAVTGKPMDHYEPYVELLSQVLANGLALTTDREFLLGLDRTVPLHEAVRSAARDSIKWRFAFEIDRIEAAHDAEVRARAFTSAAGIARSYDTGYDTTAASIAEALKESAGVVAEEPEWEYAWEADEAVRTTTRPRGPRILFDGMVYPPETIALFARGRRIRRRKAGPWVPVEQEGADGG